MGMGTGICRGTWTVIRPRLRVGRVSGRALGIALAASLLFGASAKADDSEYTREGPYVGVAGVFALENASDTYSFLHNTGGVNIQAGYRMAPSTALELYGEWLEYQGENPGSFGISLKLYIPELFGFDLAGGIIQPYAIGSAGFILARGIGNDMQIGGNFRGGVGVDFYLSESFALYGQVHYSGAGGQPTGIESTNFLAGALIRF